MLLSDNILTGSQPPSEGMDESVDAGEEVTTKCLTPAELISEQIQAIEDVNQIFQVRKSAPNVECGITWVISRWSS